MTSNSSSGEFLDLGTFPRQPAPIVDLLRTPQEVMRNPVTTGWHRLPPQAEHQLQVQLSPIDGQHRLHNVTTLYAQAALPFYDDVRLIRLIDGTWSPSGLSVYFLAHGNTLFRLDGSSRPIHDVNAIAKLRISSETVLEYLRFFCFFVHGENGPFLLSESPHQSFVPAVEDLQLLDLMEDILRPPIKTGTTEEGHYACSSVIFYGNGLFTAEFEVSTDGQVMMLDDDPIFSDLPISVHAPLG